MTRHGSRHEEHAGRLVRIVDRTGATWAALTWDGDRLVELTVPGAIVHGDVLRDPLLGAAHAIDHAEPRRRATTMSEVCWPRPGQIPAIAAPALLPPGSAAPLLNTIAVLADRAGVPALRYAGPYPTAALYRSLARSFRTTATEAQFTADTLARAATLARDEIALDFVPAPHESHRVPGGHVELRDGLERAVIEGVSYVPGGSPARLCAGPAATHRAELWFGDAPWAHVATFDRDGMVLDGPHPIPPCTSAVIGRAFPLPLRAAIAELVEDTVPPPLAADARAVLVARPVRWADLGARLAARDGDGFAVHAALWERIAPRGLGQLALALAEALAPVVIATIVAEIGELGPR